MLSNELVARLTEQSRQTPVITTSRVMKAKDRLSDASAGTLLLAPPGESRELALGLEIETARGACWRIDAPVSELWPEQERWLTALAKRVVPTQPDDETHVEISALRDALPDRIVLIDLDTCGSQVFLAGLLHTHKGLPIVTQLLARQASEEAALLSALDEIVADKRVLITFNGKSFDWPLVQERRTSLKLGRSAAKKDLVHCDLLYHSRRRWKDRFPNCKLQTLEQYVCGRQRAVEPVVRDISHSYQDYVRSGDANDLHGVLQNNALDLVTLWQLALWIAHV